MRDIQGLDSLALMKQHSFAVSVINSFPICVPLAAYYSFAPVFLEEVGVQDPAFNMSFGQVSEIFFMVVMPLFFARLDVKKMLLVGMLAWVLQYGLFAAAADQRIQWMVLSGIVLHGICYDFFFVTGQIYVNKQAPAGIRSQAQGFLVLVTQGLGMFIGAQVMGWVEAAYTTGDSIQWQGLWIIPCVAAAVISVIFFALFREDTRAADSSLPPAHGRIEAGPLEPGAADPLAQH